MKEEVRYRWRIKWAGKWTTTKAHATWEQISKEHPEATPLEYTRDMLLVPENDEELAVIAKQNCTGAFLRKLAEDFPE